MITLDQVLLLEKKVESAVAKIAQLNAENAALRSKCTELTNALSAKTEQFSSFQSDQGKIEEGILKALERLNTLENAVHATAAPGVATAGTAPSAASPAAQAPVQEPVTIPEPSLNNISVHSFDTAAPVQTQPETNAVEQNQEQVQLPPFDLF